MIGRVARFMLSDALLVDALHLPEGTRILDVSFPRVGGGYNIHVLVEHEGLQVSEGTIRDASPQFTRDEQGVVRFEGWGQ